MNDIYVFLFDIILHPNPCCISCLGPSSPTSPLSLSPGLPLHLPITTPSSPQHLQTRDTRGPDPVMCHLCPRDQGNHYVSLVVTWCDVICCRVVVWCRILDTGTRTFIVNIWVILISTSLAIWDHSLIISLLWMECNKHELNMNIIMSSLSKSNIKIIFLVAELFVRVSDPKKVMFFLIFTKIIQD